MRQALVLARALDPALCIDGEMRGDANVLVMPNIDAANITFNVLRMAAGNGIAVGGILLGAARAVHILAPSATVRRIVNMTALAAVDAASRTHGD